jgi:hypothetical protein
MKAYLATTGTLFALLALVHVWETIAQWRRLASDPGFFWMPVLGLLAAGLSIWAWSLLRVAKSA